LFGFTVLELLRHLCFDAVVLRIAVGAKLGVVVEAQAPSGGELGIDA
jgi:hypothetical protein